MIMDFNDIQNLSYEEYRAKKEDCEEQINRIVLNMQLMGEESQKLLNELTIFSQQLKEFAASKGWGD